MKKGLVWMLTALMIMGCFLVSACGDDDDAPAEGNAYEVCIIGLLPKAVAPYATFEMNYNDEQGTEQKVVLKASDTSDVLPAEIRREAQLLTMGMVDVDKCIVRYIKYAVPEGHKVYCRYKTLLNGVEIQAPTDSYFQPFALVVCKQKGTESLILPRGFSVGSSTGTSKQVFQSLLEKWDGRENMSEIHI